MREIHVEHLVKTFGQQRALDDVGFRIAVGDATFFDAERRLSVPAERRNLGIVFQSYAVWPHMTVFENLAFPLRVRKLKRARIRERVDEVLGLVEMPDYGRRYP